MELQKQLEAYEPWNEQEESGICRVRPVSDAIFSLEVLTVDGHIKRGEYVSSHLHLNVTYLLEASESAPLSIKADENKAVGWFGLKEAVAASTEPWFQEHVYEKLNKKLSGFYKNEKVPDLLVRGKYDIK